MNGFATHFFFMDEAPFPTWDPFPFFFFESLPLGPVFVLVVGTRFFRDPLLIPCVSFRWILGKSERPGTSYKTLATTCACARSPAKERPRLRRGLAESFVDSGEDERILFFVAYIRQRGLSIWRFYVVSFCYSYPSIVVTWLLQALGHLPAEV